MFWSHGAASTPPAPITLIFPSSLHRILKLFLGLQGPARLHRHKAPSALRILYVWPNSTTDRWNLTQTGVWLASVKCFRLRIVKLLTLRSCALATSLIAKTFATLAGRARYRKMKAVMSPAIATRAYWACITSGVRGRRVNPDWSFMSFLLKHTSLDFCKVDLFTSYLTQ